MLPLLKKKTEASSPAAVAWHPNFRNFERLPDTKAVRTSFLVNGVMILIATVLLLWCGYNVYQLHELNRQIDDVQRQIDRDRKPSEQAVALYKKFQTEAAAVSQVDAFLKSRPLVSEILIHIGDTVPAYLALDRFGLRDTGASIIGTVRGAPDKASGRASSYLQQLKADSFFTARFSEINLVNLSPKTKGEGLVLEIALKLKEAKKP